MLEDIAFRASHKIRGPIARIQGLTNLMDVGFIQKDELTKVMEYFKDSVLEMDFATSELTSFINTHFEDENLISHCHERPFHHQSKRSNITQNPTPTVPTSL